MYKSILKIPTTKGTIIKEFSDIETSTKVNNNQIKLTIKQTVKTWKPKK